MAGDQQAARPPDTIAGRFDQAARRNPGGIAVRWHGQAVSYQELAGAAGGLAARLARHGVQTGARVGICLDRSPAAIAAILGTLRASCTYLALDPALPPARLAAIARISGVSAVITDEASRPRIGTLGDCCLIIEDAAPRPAVGPGSLPPARRRPQPPDIAYILCTSGSTGVPKPVAVSHAQVLALYQAGRRSTG